MSDAVTGKAGNKLARPPFKGPVESVDLREPHKGNLRHVDHLQGTKVINELRLDLSRDEDSALYDKHMREFLGIDEVLYAKLQGGASSKA